MGETMLSKPVTKRKYFILPHGVSEVVRFIETENKVMITKELFFNGYKVSDLQNEKVMVIHSTVNTLIIIELYTYQWLR